MEGEQEDDDALLLAALPTDSEAALELLFTQCPPGSRLGGTLPAVWLHMLYAIVKDSTATDRELEAQRLSHALRLLRLPSQGEDTLIVRAADYAAAMRAAAVAAKEEKDPQVAAALRTAATALPHCTGLRVRAAELQRAVGVDGERAASMCAALLRRGWLAKPPLQLRTGPDEAPAPVEDGVWLWSYPRCGMLAASLRGCRAAVIGALRKHRFERATTQVVERTPAVQAALRAARLDFRTSLRDLLGRRLVLSTPAAGGVSGGATLQLSPAGRQEAHHTSGRGKKRRR